MKIRLSRYPLLGALVVAGALAVAPQATHATYQSVGACTAGTAATTLGGLQVQVKGATNNAIPIVPVASATTSTMVDSTTGMTVTTTTMADVMTTTTTTGTGLITTTTSPVSAQDYGYITEAQGLSSPFLPGVNNASNALLTYYSTTNSLVDNTDFMPYSTRTGTLTVYAATGQAGDFSTPSSFMSGTAVLTATYTQWNVGSMPFNLIGGSLFGMQTNLTGSKGQTGIGQDFSTFGTATVTGSSPFMLDGACYTLAAPGTTFTMHNVGHLASPTSVNGAYTGVWGNAGVM
jgi:hypothetical protein